MRTPPGPGSFPARNRLISGLADAVVVVEGGADSGAMITAAHAMAQGRSVFAVPGSVYAPGSRGPHRLLAAGAKILADPEDVLAVLDGVGPSAGAPSAGEESRRCTGDRALEPPTSGGMWTVERRVLTAVDPGEGRSVDQVAAAAGMDVAAVAAALVALEVHGAVRRVAGGLYVRDGAAPEGRRRSTDCRRTGGTVWLDHWS